MKKTIFILLLILFSGICALAQNYKHDQNFCKIYEMSMNYINRIYTDGGQRYVFDDSLVKPDNPRTGHYIKKVQHEQLNFYILEKKSRFNSNDVKYWFSDLLKDNTLKLNKYYTDTGSIMTCTFSENLNFQFRNYDEVRNFTPQDFRTEIKGVDTIHYTPVRITFSTVLYNMDIALVYAKLFIGLGGGPDVTAYAFEFKKKNGKWILVKAESEVL